MPYADALAIQQGLAQISTGHQDLAGSCGLFINSINETIPYQTDSQSLLIFFQKIYYSNIKILIAYSRQLHK